MRPGLEINKETNKNKNNMLMKTKYFIFAASALVALASCSSNDFVGDESLLENNGSGAIAFSSSTPAITRADKTGSAAATDLNNNFVVFGYKTVSSATQAVFDNYQANYVASSAKSTTTNSAGWEYVGYKNLPNGVGTDAGVTAFATTTTGDPNNSTAIDQSIKYWDFSASKYDFFAYSLGAGSTSTWARASKMTNTGYSLEGDATQLGACYISNKKTVVPSTSATEVDLEFRSFNSKIQLGFYETIPGYSVKDVKFYPSADGTSGTTPSLYAASAVVPNGGKYTVTFDANGKAQLALAASDPAPTTISKVDFSTLTDYAGAEYKEDNTSTVYLRRASNVATKTNEVKVLPNPANVNALNVKMDFTLVSRDGTGETIEMTGATAVIPAAYAMWLPNYKYTYLFKISDNTNAKTAAITGLYPITLDAVITDAVDGSQETITTVDDPSITTYAKGTMVTANNEYKTGANIYIVVDDGTTTITPENNATLYTATIEEGAAQGITEETVKNALVNGTESPTGTWTVTDALGKKLEVTKTTGLTAITSIDASDAPNGVAIDVKGAKFTPASAGDYVFEYSASAKNYTQDEANAYNATLTGAISTENTAYSFTSYNNSEKTVTYGTGKVKFISTSGDWTTVLVTANTPTDINAANFIGQQFKVNATTIEDNTVYQLYPLTGDPLPIYVTVSTSSFTSDDVNAYNATLAGHKTTSDVKTPAANHYKVIKVVAP